jgi:hypothetical protein
MTAGAWMTRRWSVPDAMSPQRGGPALVEREDFLVRAERRSADAVGIEGSAGGESEPFQVEELSLRIHAAPGIPVEV